MERGTGGPHKESRDKQHIKKEEIYIQGSVTDGSRGGERIMNLLSTGPV